MNMKKIALCCLLVTVISSAGYKNGRAESAADKGRLKVGVVSVRRILRDSKIAYQYKQEVLSVGQKNIAKLDKLAREIQSAEARLKTLKVGSTDYLKNYQEILQKRANLQAEREFYEEERKLKTLKITEQTYKDILRVTGEVAEQMVLDLVLEGGQVDLATSDPTQLQLTMATNKLIYSSGCVDITDQVLARLDAGK